MKIQKRWLVGGLAALLLGATSCQKSNNVVAPQVETEGTTYMSVAINLNQQQEELLRAAGEENNEHNPVGHWEGRDKINGVDIYIVDTNDGSVVTKGLNVLTTPQGGANNSAGADGVYATGAWKVEPGQKKLYVVVNNSGAIKTALDDAADNGATAATDFETAYKAAYDYTISTYAKEETGKDVILMSGEPKEITILDGISESQATIQSAGTANVANNQFSVKVRRSAARVTVTYNPAFTDATVVVKSDDAATTSLGKLKLEGWYYGQFEKKSNLLWDATGVDGSTDVKAYLNRTTKSPSYDFVVTDATSDKQNRETKYEYSTLLNANKVDIKPLKDNQPTVANIIAAGNMKFLAETTHQYGPEAVTGYRKGNTPYVLIETVFTPADDSWASTEEKTGYAEGKDLYYSTYNGKFYKSLQNAQAVYPGNAGKTIDTTKDKDQVVTFKGGKMYYYAWLNPDKLSATEWFNSPVLRNNIYHINVTGFKKLGFSGDPFNPTPDNDKPVDPDDDVPSVTEKLNVKETWMSTEITVVNWGVHTYGISF